MPGLLNRVTGANLPLTVSDVTSYVSGYALGLTASLTYGNLEAQPFQGNPVWISWNCLLHIEPLSCHSLAGWYWAPFCWAPSSAKWDF